jgi:predicted glutamine amidotransferase
MCMYHIVYMCRILFALNQSHLKKKINDFLKQSDQPHKHTPGLDSESDHTLHMDGFGFAYFNSVTHKWKSVKSPKHYKNVENMETIINQVSVSHTVIGHIRKQTGEAGVSMVNTHPFTHKNQLFMHNGTLFGYDTIKHKLQKQIAPEYRSYIRGTTDTEWMFYLFLTIKDYLEKRVPPHNSNINSKSVNLLEECKEAPIDLLASTVCRFFQHLYKQFGEFTANIVYANKEFTVITRCVKSHNGALKAPSLYINGEVNPEKLLVSSEPILEKYKLIPEQTIIVVCNTTGKYMIKNLFQLCDIHL